VSKHQTPQRQFAEDERQRLELEARGGLDQLVQLLTKAAHSAAADQKTEFTDTERERLCRQSDILSGAVAELIKILTDHPYAHIREYRLANLFEALGSTAFLAPLVVENPTFDRLRAAPATERRLEMVQKSTVVSIICEEFDTLRKQQPDTEWGPWEAARVCYEPINKRIAKLIRGKKIKGKPLETDSIARYLKKHHPYFSKSD
jgi:LPS O-antigen subunit length determinant protein (WzzB/FepE family)